MIWVSSAPSYCPIFVFESALLSSNCFYNEDTTFEALHQAQKYGQPADKGLTPRISGAVSGTQRTHKNGASRPPLQRLVRPALRADHFHLFAKRTLVSETTTKQSGNR